MLAGEASVRELAAFLLDRDGFAGVPATALVRISANAFSQLQDSEQKPEWIQSNVHDQIESLLAQGEFQQQAESDLSTKCSQTSQRS